MRLVVTGAYGFIGKNLVRELKRHGKDEIICLDKDDYSEKNPLDEKIACDVIYHLAGNSNITMSWESPLNDLASNVADVIRILEWGREKKAKKIILASSAAVYGAMNGKLDEDNILKPISPYGLSKATAEKYATLYNKKWDVDIRIARIGNPYGEGQKRFVIYDLIKKALMDGDPLSIHGDGQQIRDFIHVKDVVNALICISECGISGSVYNVGSGSPISILKLAERIAQHCGIKTVAPNFKEELGKTSMFIPNIERIKKIGFSPKISLDHGLVETIEWVRGQL